MTTATIQPGQRESLDLPDTFAASSRSEDAGTGARSEGLGTRTVERGHFAVDIAFLSDAGSQKPDGIKRIYSAKAMHAGQPNGWHIAADVLSASVDLWAGAGIYVDHPSFFDAPSVRNLIGAFRNVRFTENHIEGDIHIFDIPQAIDTIALLDTIISQRDAGLATPPTGLSAVLSFEWTFNEDTRERHVSAIAKVWSLDVVFEPASVGSTVTRVLNSVSQSTMNEQTQTPTETNTTKARPEPVEGPATSAVPALSTALLQAQCELLLNTKLQTAGFPPAVAATIRSKFTNDAGNVAIFTPAELDAEIASARAIAAAFSGDAVQGMGEPAARRNPRIHGMFNERDQIAAAYDRLMGLQPSNGLKDVAKLSGIRELYIGLTGDRDFHGVYQPEQAQFAITVADSPRTSTIFADLTANVMNKLVLEATMRMAAGGYMWWKKAAKVGNFNTLQPTRWVRLGGVGDLPTVAEGGAYTELTWDDAGQSVPFVKKGGFLALTLEMIDRDDTTRWRAAGDALGVAAVRTISGAVAGIFTGNPAITEDGLTMFHASHGNTGVTALSAAAWDTVVQAIFKMSELNSTKRLGYRPDRVLVPIELRKTAMSLFYSVQEPGGANNDINVAGASTGTAGSFSDDGPVLVVPEFTDANDWFALCNPELCPVVGVGFRYGETPEIMSLADPNSYLMFFQDALPIKVRWVYAVGGIDWRGAYRQVVP